jgi:Spy/CpxP family protein refolding chaperone
MLKSKSLYLLALAAIVGLGFASQAISQDSRPADTGNRGNRGTRNLEQMRADMEKRMKESLGVTDDEWKVLQPKIDKVTTLQRESRGNMFRGMGRNRGGDQPAPEPKTDVEKAMVKLTDTLKNKDAKPEDIKAALTALRDARGKVKEELEKAQKELKEVLTVKQEAQLVANGVLE